MFFHKDLSINEKSARGEERGREDERESAAICLHCSSFGHVVPKA